MEQNSFAVKKSSNRRYYS